MDIESRIQFLKSELSKRKGQEGWLIEGLRNELERLEVKLKKLKIKK